MTKTEKWEWENNKKGDGVGDCEEREWIWVHVKFERKGKDMKKEQLSWSSWSPSEMLHSFLRFQYSNVEHKMGT